MKTISIIGADWSGPDPQWIRQPWSPTFNRMHPADWDLVFHELGELARVDGIAVGIRGAYDVGAVESMPVARASYLRAPVKPTLMPFYDTGALPDIAGEPDVAHAFDFENPQHIQWGWDRYARIFFDHFADLPLERSPNGKVLLLWWSNDAWIGHGFINQRSGQRLLDAVDRQIADLGLGGADHIVDRSWVRHDPQIRVYGVHEWFNPWKTPPSAYSISSHNGVTVGLTVPSFYHKIEPQGGAVLRNALAACRQANADYVFLESGTNFQEAAELMRDSTGDTSKLDAVREHVALVKGTEPMPVPPQPAPPLGSPVPPVAKATFAISRRESFEIASKPGYFATWHPKGQRDTILSVQGNGDIVTRLLHAAPAPEGVPFDPTVHGLDGQPGEWEGWKVEGSRAVFDGTPEYFAIPLVD